MLEYFTGILQIEQLAAEHTWRKIFFTDKLRLQMLMSRQRAQVKLRNENEIKANNNNNINKVGVILAGEWSGQFYCLLIVILSHHKVIQQVSKVEVEEIQIVEP